MVDLIPVSLISQSLASQGCELKQGTNSTEIEAKVRSVHSDNFMNDNEYDEVVSNVILDNFVTKDAPLTNEKRELLKGLIKNALNNPLYDQEIGEKLRQEQKRNYLW